MNITDECLKYLKEKKVKKIEVKYEGNEKEVKNPNKKSKLIHLTESEKIEEHYKFERLDPSFKNKN